MRADLHQIEICKNHETVLSRVIFSRAEMGTTRVWLKDELQGLSAKARKLEAAIATNVAGILEA